MTKRRYNSPLRQQQAAATRERIVAAGAKLVHSYPAWDWTNLTAPAVGERAGVSERTVQRHFATERQLRDAVLQRMLEESGIALQDLELDHFADVTERMFAYLSSFAIAPEPVSDPSFASMDEYRRDALLNAVARATPGWAGSRSRSRCSGARHFLESTDLRTTCRRLGLRFRARHTCTVLAYPPDRGSDTRRSSPRPSASESPQRRCVQCLRPCQCSRL